MSSPSLPHPGDPQGLPQPLPWTPQPQDCPSLLRGHLLTPPAPGHRPAARSRRGQSEGPVVHPSRPSVYSQHALCPL